MQQNASNATCGRITLAELRRGDGASPSFRCQVTTNGSVVPTFHWHEPTSFPWVWGFFHLFLNFQSTNFHEVFHGIIWEFFRIWMLHLPWNLKPIQHLKVLGGYCLKLFRNWSYQAKFVLQRPHCRKMFIAGLLCLPSSGQRHRRHGTSQRHTHELSSAGGSHPTFLIHLWNNHQHSFTHPNIEILLTLGQKKICKRWCTMHVFCVCFIRFRFELIQQVLWLNRTCFKSYDALPCLSDGN